MKYDFDKKIDRRNTYSIKYDVETRGKSKDTLPLWVADMDFQTPDCVLEAMQAQVQHGIFGYSESDRGYFETLKGWFSHRHGWEVEENWLVKTPGIVTAIYMAINALTDPGDAVIIQQPVYYPFASAVNDTGRKLVVSELVYQDGAYSINFEDFEEKIKENKVKLFILCNPHNPVGRVWTIEELSKLGEICLRNDVLVISDEIHEDFVYPGNRHNVFASISPELRECTITCTAPSKSFNLAGLGMSNIFISNDSLREKFEKKLSANGLSQLGVMGIVACKAAYDGGGEWLDELIEYLESSFAMTREFLSERIPQIKLVEPQGTYLAWLDCKELGLSPKALDNLVLNKAKLWLDDGAMFGKSGEGFQRVNIACPKATLREALIRLEAAVKAI